MRLGDLLFDRSGLNALTNHDDGEEYELQESLRDPGDDRDEISGLYRRGKGDKSDRSEEISAPHRGNTRGDLGGQAGIEIIYLVGHKPSLMKRDNFPMLIFMSRLTS